MMKTLKKELNKFSIIMPVYNVAKYISDAVDSVLKQSYKNFELILVNDGSTDDSYEIILKIAETDDRIRIVNKVNGGLSDARNEGMKYTSGDYIFFMDSDDFISPELFDIVDQQLNNRSVKVVMIGYQYFDDIRTSDGRMISSNVYTGEDILHSILLGKLENYVWQFIIHKSVLSQDLSFKKNLLFEDIDWTPRLLSKVNLIKYIRRPLYFYRKRHDSIVHTKNLKKTNDLRTALSLMKETIQESFPMQVKYIDNWRQSLDLTIYYDYSILGWKNSSDRIRFREKIQKFKNKDLTKKQLLKKYIITFRFMDIITFITRHKQKK